MTEESLAFANQISGKWFLVNTDKIWEFNTDFDKDENAKLIIRDTAGNYIDTLNYTPIVMKTSTTISINPAIDAFLLIYIDINQMSLKNSLGEIRKFFRAKLSTSF